MNKSFSNQRKISPKALWMKEARETALSPVTTNSIILLPLIQ